MKVNKVSHWIYGLLMLMPFFMWVGYMLYGVLTRTSTINNAQDFFASSWSSITGGGAFDWIEQSPFYVTITDFCELFGLELFNLDYLFTYMITISVGYLGIEVLLAFINIARKLVYAFVDKEF